MDNTLATPPSGVGTTVRERAVRCYAGFARVLDTLAPLYLLAARLYVAKVFMLSGWLKFSRWDATLALFENEYHVPVLAPQVAAVMATIGELGFSTLLIAGLGSRAAALGLFAVNAVAVVSYPGLSAAGLKDHILWGALLLVVAIYGPGRLSIDRWIGGR
jgi:putative oxidoreductase